MNLNFTLEVPPKFYLVKRCAICQHSTDQEFVDEKGMVSRVFALCTINDKPTDRNLEVRHSKCIAYEPVDEVITRVNDYKELT